MRFTWLTELAAQLPVGVLRLLALLVAVLLLLGVPELAPLLVRLCASSSSSLLLPPWPGR